MISLMEDLEGIVNERLDLVVLVTSTQSFDAERPINASNVVFSYRITSTVNRLHNGGVPESGIGKVIEKYLRTNDVDVWIPCRSPDRVYNEDGIGI